MFNRFKKPTFGLVLNGGGSRGAYQLGVLLALKKYGLYDRCKGIAGGSVGSFVALIYLLDDPIKAIDIWSKIDSSVIKSPKPGNIFSRIPLNGVGYYSREGVINFINQNFDLESYIHPSIPVYISTAKESTVLIDKKTKEVVEEDEGDNYFDSEAFIEQQMNDSGEKKPQKKVKTKEKYVYSPVYFKLSDYTKDEVMKILLASSAIPLVYDKVEINGDYYVDCLRADNEPYKALDDEEFDMLFVIPLTRKHNKMDYSDYKVPVVDFELPSLINYVSTLSLDMIDFEKSKTDDYIIKGYVTAKAIFDRMKKEHVLCKPVVHHWFRKKKAKDLINKVYSLKTLNIDEESLHFERWTMDRVLNDYKKKGRKLNERRN